jgi:signal transduction histidine kinase
MKTPKPLFPRWLEYGVLTLTFVLLAAYSYARFFVAPYVGFQISSSGQVVDVFIEQTQAPVLAVGDRILAVNNIDWDEWDSREQNPFLLHGRDESISLEVQSSDGQKELLWTPPGFNQPELLSRLFNTWWLSYIFWLAGAVTAVLVRPKDQRWALLIAFNLITAVWFMAGSISAWSVWGSGLVLRGAVWLTLPIYLHLHWNFPRPLLPTSPWIWRALYTFGVLGMVLQVTGFLPDELYYWPLMIAFAVSILILFVRLVIRRNERRDIGLLFFAVIVALAPALAVSVASLRDTVPVYWPGTLFSLLALPGAYVFVVYRRQLGGLELRANRLVSIYLFLMLIITLALLILPFFSSGLNDPQAAGGAVLLSSLVATIVGVLGFPRFERFVERRLLNIPQPPERLVQSYAGRIATGFGYEHLADLLPNEVLASLLVRQSALLAIDAEDTATRLVYLQGLNTADLPKRPEQQLILSKSMELRKLNSDVGYVPENHAWIRYAFPLVIGGKAIGLWLFGRKDPDDYYSQPEQATLASLADQTAIALVNIAQAQRLRAMHQSDIDRQEGERLNLALELHDGVLQRMNVLLSEVGNKIQSKEFDSKHKELSELMRRVINGLRPPMLNYGLYRAFEELADEISENSSSKTRLYLEMTPGKARFDPLVEQHVYRIIQQACENALKHSQAKSVFITGSVSPKGVDVKVEDDGKGFDLGDGQDLSQLLEERHFGLVGMLERAALIGATLTIDSAKGKGTRIHLQVSPENSAV